MPGQTIVLVHGAFADHHAFDALAPLLRDAGYRVLAPDLANAIVALAQRAR